MATFVSHLPHIWAMARDRKRQASVWASSRDESLVLARGSDKAASPDEIGSSASLDKTSDGASPDETGNSASLDEAGDVASLDEFGEGASSNEAGGRARVIPLVPCPTPSPALPISNFAKGMSKHDLVFAMSLDS
jgi:hypothetical protein